MSVSDDDEDDRIGGIPLELWRDPDTKWLDPANGIGNFPFVAFEMLDYQLKNHGTKGSKGWSDKKRKKHIVEKMLYMIEIDRGNVNTCYKVMDLLVPGAKPNICCADTLALKDADLERHFGVSRFDVVMGNPPFNTIRIVKGQTGTLWDKFILSNIQKLTDRGILVFITPQLWRKPEHILFKKMSREMHIDYLRILGEKETLNKFHVGSRVDTYIISKMPKQSMSYIIDEVGKLNIIDVKDFNFIPNYEFATIQKILVSDGPGLQIIHDRTMYGHDKKNVNKNNDQKYKFPVVNSITMNGLSLLYADSNKGHFGIPKVILSVGRHQYPVNDYEGQYGLSDSVFGIPISSKEEGDLIVEAVNNPRFKEIIKATKWGTFQTEYRMFKYFRPDFYKEFLPSS